MSEQALIDGLKFARERQRLQGEVALAQLPRVVDELLDPAGSVCYALTGFVDGRGRPGIEVDTRGRLAMICQRCLSRLDFELDRHTRFMLVAESGELPDLALEDAEIETVPLEAVANVADLIEQEVLLGLPISPAHAQCSAPAELRPVERASPFAVLGRLKDTAPGN